MEILSFCILIGLSLGNFYYSYQISKRSQANHDKTVKELARRTLIPANLTPIVEHLPLASHDAINGDF